MRSLIIGSGFVGSALAHHLSGLRQQHGGVVLASRRPPHAWAETGAGAPKRVALDALDAQAVARTVRHEQPDVVVLVHGPSDVTWCAGHPEQALRGHVQAARNAVRAAAGRRIVLISTDNVFDGTRPRPDESARTRAANAYGRAKLAAEEVVAGVPGSCVLRVSLIYGWESGENGKWLNYFASCARRLRAGEPVEAPYDQWTTPVLLDDVVAVATAVATAAQPPPLLHLGGPDRVSRAQWAAAIAEACAAPAELVVPVSRGSGRYADRPESSCLGSHVLGNHPATSSLRIRGAHEGTRLLFAQAEAEALL